MKRITRLRYAVYELILMIFYFSFTIEFRKTANNIGIIIIFLIMAIINIYITIGRLRDFNNSGYWWLFGLIPCFNFIFYITLFFIPGTYGLNKYGDDPRTKERSSILKDVFELILASFGATLLLWLAASLLGKINRFNPMIGFAIFFWSFLISWLVRKFYEIYKKENIPSFNKIKWICFAIILSGLFIAIIIT